MSDLPQAIGTCDRRNSAQSDPVAELFRYRHVLYSLTVRELRIRYKQSWLGIGWAVCVPLSMMLVFTFVFTQAVQMVDGMNINMPTRGLRRAGSLDLLRLRAERERQLAGSRPWSPGCGWRQVS